MGSRSSIADTQLPEGAREVLARDLRCHDVVLHWGEKAVVMRMRYLDQDLQGPDGKLALDVCYLSDLHPGRITRRSGVMVREMCEPVVWVGCWQVPTWP